MLAAVTPIYGNDAHTRKIFNKLFKSLLMEQPDLWVIVYDETSSWVTEYKADFIVHIKSDDPKQATKKNMALDWLETQGVDLVIFIDADQVPERELINEVKELLRKHDVVEIPERFGKPNSYLQGSYYVLREIYHETIEGIPRAFRMNIIGELRFNPRFHYVEDILFWKILSQNRRNLRTARAKKALIHYEKFSLAWFITKKLLALRGLKSLNKIDEVIGCKQQSGLRKKEKRKRSLLLTLKAIKRHKYYALGILFLTAIKIILKFAYKMAS